MKQARPQSPQGEAMGNTAWAKWAALGGGEAFCFAKVAQQVFISVVLHLWVQPTVG